MPAQRSSDRQRTAAAERVLQAVRPVQQLLLVCQLVAQQCHEDDDCELLEKPGLNNRENSQ